MAKCNQTDGETFKSCCPDWLLPLSDFKIEIKRSAFKVLQESGPLEKAEMTSLTESVYDKVEIEKECMKKKRIGSRIILSF